MKNTIAATMNSFEDAVADNIATPIDWVIRDVTEEHNSYWTANTDLFDVVDEISGPYMQEIIQLFHRVCKAL